MPAEHVSPGFSWESSVVLLFYCSQMDIKVILCRYLRVICLQQATFRSEPITLLI